MIGSKQSNKAPVQKRSKEIKPLEVNPRFEKIEMMDLSPHMFIFKLAKLIGKDIGVNVLFNMTEKRGRPEIINTQDKMSPEMEFLMNALLELIKNSHFKFSQRSLKKLDKWQIKLYTQLGIIDQIDNRPEKPASIYWRFRKHFSQQLPEGQSLKVGKKDELNQQLHDQWEEHKSTNSKLYQQWEREYKEDSETYHQKHMEWCMEHPSLLTNSERKEAGEPVKPRNAFIFFCKKHRSTITARYPNLKSKVITTKLGDAWKKVKPATKKKYKREAEKDKERYQTELKAFKAKYPDWVFAEDLKRPNKSSSSSPTGKKGRVNGYNLFMRKGNKLNESETNEEQRDRWKSLDDSEKKEWNQKAKEINDSKHSKQLEQSEQSIDSDEEVDVNDVSDSEEDSDSENVLDVNEVDVNEDIEDDSESEEEPDMTD